MTTSACASGKNGLVINRAWVFMLMILCIILSEKSLHYAPKIMHYSNYYRNINVKLIVYLKFCDLF